LITSRSFRRVERWLVSDTKKNLHDGTLILVEFQSLQVEFQGLNRPQKKAVCSNTSTSTIIRKNESSRSFPIIISLACINDS